MTEAESCPLCGALPCDWVDNPHELLSQTKQLPDERALIVKWLRSETQQCSSKCDCFAHGENECTCGAWWDAKESNVLALAESIEAGEHLK